MAVPAGRNLVAGKKHDTPCFLGRFATSHNVVLVGSTTYGCSGVTSVMMRCALQSHTSSLRSYSSMIVLHVQVVYAIAVAAMTPRFPERMLQNVKSLLGALDHLSVGVYMLDGDSPG